MKSRDYGGWWVAGLLALFALIALVGLCRGQDCRGGQCAVPTFTKPQLPIPPAQRIEAPAAVVRVGNQLDNGITDLGTGVIVARGVNEQGQDVARVLTAWHVMESGVCRPFVSTATKSYWARVDALDRGAELALLTILDPGVDPMPLAEADPQIGEWITGHGLAEGRYVPIPGAVVGYDQVLPDKGQPVGWLVCSGGQRNGDSGAPIVDQRGRVVALCWGSADHRRRCTPLSAIRRFLQAALGQHPARPPQPAAPSPPVPDLRRPTSVPPVLQQPLQTVTPGPTGPSTPPQPSQPAQSGTAVPAGPTTSGAAVPPAPAKAIEESAPAVTAGQQPGPAGPPQAAASATAGPPVVSSPTRPQTPPITSEGTNTGSKSLGESVASAAGPVVAAGAASLVAQWLPALAGGALAGGPLGLIAIWLARRGAKRIIQTVTRERPVIVPGTERTETVYVGVPSSDPWAEARLQAERLMARSDPQAARFFTYRDQLAKPQLAPTN